MATGRLDIVQDRESRPSKLEKSTKRTGWAGRRLDELGSGKHDGKEGSQSKWKLELFALRLNWQLGQEYGPIISTMVKAQWISRPIGPIHLMGFQFIVKIEPQVS